MRKAVGTLVGKSVAAVVKSRGKSGGQALPGLIVESLIPGYLGLMLQQLPEGVIVITGTNGKTTTTKMVVELLRSNGKRVLTNPTGSNLTRGVISSVSQQARTSGKLPFDMAVFELDEAYAKQFTNVNKPRIVLGLNASRDQLDRFGEVDKVASLISETMLAAQECIITNADDKRLRESVVNATVPVKFFGVDNSLLSLFPRDDELVSVESASKRVSHKNLPMASKLVSFEGDHAVYELENSVYSVTLKVTGQHNFQNAAAALALVAELLPNCNRAMLVNQLANVKPAFGRGQSFSLKDGSSLQLNLVKNPASFRQGLASYIRPSVKVMFAINDRIADSRDMSWLWDVDFSSISYEKVDYTAGSRAIDMALRLVYDEVETLQIEPDIDTALREFCSLEGEKVIFASYTAMLHIHSALAKKAGKIL